MMKQKTNLGKLEERPWVPSKIVNVKHRLRVWKIGEIYSKTCINSISRTKVRYATRNRYLQKKRKNNNMHSADRYHVIT